MHINLIVPIGIVRFVFYDELTNKFRVEEIGKNNYARLTIPKGIFFGFILPIIRAKTFLPLDAPFVLP